MKTTSATACTRVGMSLMSLLTMPGNTILLLLLVLVTASPCWVSSCPGPQSPVYCRAMLSRGLVCPATATTGPATQPVSPGSSGHLTVPQSGGGGLGQAVPLYTLPHVTHHTPSWPGEDSQLVTCLAQSVVVPAEKHEENI